MKLSKILILPNNFALWPDIQQTKKIKIVFCPTMSVYNGTAHGERVVTSILISYNKFILSRFVWPITGERGIE